MTQKKGGAGFFLQRSSNVKAENRFLKFVVLVLGVSVVFSFYETHRLMAENRTIIVPPVVDSVMSVRGDMADDEYLRSMTRYVAALLFTYSPATARTQFDELLHLYAPEAFGGAKDWLYERAGTIESSRTSGAFYPEKISFVTDASGHSIHVRGEENLSVDDVSVARAVKEYVIDYRLDNGRFWIEGVSEREKRT